MERVNVKSSNIKSIGYDEATKTLEIEFTKSGLYQYKEVPKEIYEGFSKAESIGKYFYANIKSNRALKFEKVVTILKQEDVQFVGVSLVSNPPPGCEIKEGTIEYEVVKNPNKEYCKCDKPTPTPVLGEEEYIGCSNCGKEIIQTRDI